MNWFDIVVILILVLSVFTGMKRGFIKAFFGVIATIVSIVLTYSLYKPASKFIREHTPIYNALKDFVSNAFDVSKFNTSSIFGQTDAINSISLPSSLKTALISNNNTEIYDILHVSTLADYISGYISNIIVNAIAIVLVFLIVTFILSWAVKVLGVVAKLPLISTFDTLGGMVFGAVGGVLSIWFIFLILTAFISMPQLAEVNLALENSTVAKFMYESNILLTLILKVLA